MRILVTGGAGFIGQNLVRELLKLGHAVSCIDIVSMDHLGSVEKLQADITDDGQMDVVATCLQRRIDACVHLAAIAAPTIAQKNPALAWSTNVHGTQNVLGALRRIGCKRVVFFSSAHVYGISPKYLPTDECHPLALHDTYTTTKIVGEDLCRLHYENHGVSYVNLRLWNAYGPEQNKDYFIGAKLRQAQIEGRLSLRNSEVTKDWIHVSDVVQAAVAAISSGYVGPLNIGTGVETSLRQIVEIIARHYDAPITKDATVDDGPTRMRCNNTRARLTLGWEPLVDVTEGMRRLLGPDV